MNRASAFLVLLISLLCPLHAQEATGAESATWNGLDTRSVYLSDGHPGVAFAVDAGASRLLAVTYAGGLGSLRAIGTIASPQRIGLRPGLHAMDIHWHANAGSLFQGDSVLTAEGGKLTLDGVFGARLSEEPDLTALLADFDGVRVPAATPQKLSLLPNRLYRPRMGTRGDLFVTASGKQVVYRHSFRGRNDINGRVCRGWVRRSLDGQSGSIVWEDTASSPGNEMSSDWMAIEGSLGFMLRVGDIERVDFHPLDYGTKETPGSPQAEYLRVAKELRAWSVANAGESSPLSWKGWVRDAVYERQSQDGSSEFLWAEPSTARIHLVRLGLGEESPSTSIRGELVGEARLFQGPEVIHVAWERGQGFATFAASPQSVEFLGSSATHRSPGLFSGPDEGTLGPSGAFKRSNRPVASLRRYFEGAPEMVPVDYVAPKVNAGDLFVSRDSSRSRQSRKLFALVLPGGGEVLVNNQRHRLFIHKGELHCFYGPDRHSMFFLPEGVAAGKTPRWEHDHDFTPHKDRTGTLARRMVTEAGWWPLIEGVTR